MKIFLIIVGVIVAWILLKQLLKRTQTCPHCGANNSKVLHETHSDITFKCKSCGAWFTNFKD